jgi:hypothetical protein
VAVAIEVARRELRRQQAGRERPFKPDESALAQGEQRDPVGARINAGKQRPENWAWT